MYWQLVKVDPTVVHAHVHTSLSFPFLQLEHALTQTHTQRDTETKIPEPVTVECMYACIFKGLACAYYVAVYVRTCVQVYVCLCVCV